MTEHDFTLEDLRREVLALADERPGFVYINQKEPVDPLNCSYTGASIGSTEGEACIFGQALTRLGVPQEVLMDNTSKISILLRKDLGFRELDSVRANALDEVQCEQDRGNSWGMAVHPLRYMSFKGV